VEISRQFAEHINRKSWNDTLFQFFLNGKNDFKKNGWSRGSSPWLLDEPASFQDYWALRYFGVAFHEGANQSRGQAKLVFRSDISRPQWQRNTFDGLLDYNVVGGAFRTYRRMVLDRKQAHGEIVVEYGSANAIDESNMQAVGWSIDSWALGSDGVLPWQTIGTNDSWSRADTLSLFYPPRPGKDAGPIPSVRLKAFRRGQQDVEYLTLYAFTKGEPRWAVGQRVREALKLTGERKGTGFAGGEDAGVIHFANLRPQDVWELRTRIGRALSQAKPAAKAKLVDLRTPQRDLSKLAPGYVSTGESPSQRGADTGGSETSAQRETTELQGRAYVRDTLLDPSQPDRALGSAPRDNAIRKGDTTSAFLVRFDLTKLASRPSAKVAKATVSFFVWDPSSQGRTKLVAFPLKTTWDEARAAWRQPSSGKAWIGRRNFAIGADTEPAAGQTIVEPDRNGDTADPPIPYSVDVTAPVRAWLAGKLPNHGLALVPISDRSIDDGAFTRFQVYASEYQEAKYTPKLTIEWDAATPTSR
jgi:hypothetical protein